jgi:4-hydroxy-3-methylbut-2-enyl diphosphate reductase
MVFLKNVGMQFKESGFKVKDATCPLVRFAHRKLTDLVENGFYPVIIGKANHVEVQGMVEDLEEFTVISEKEEVSRLKEVPRLGVVAQTTQRLDYVLEMIDLIQKHFPFTDIRFQDTVCRPTKERQEAAKKLAKACELVIVIGGKESNNTKELVQTCRSGGARVYRVNSAKELCSEWFEQVRSVGVTAGTSTPEELIEEVDLQIRYYGSL